MCVCASARERKRERPQQQKNDVHIFEAKNVTKISPTAKKVSQEFFDFLSNEVESNLDENLKNRQTGSTPNTSWSTINTKNLV